MTEDVEYLKEKVKRLELEKALIEEKLRNKANKYDHRYKAKVDSASDSGYNKGYMDASNNWIGRVHGALNKTKDKKKRKLLKSICRCRKCMLLN